jgi:5-dehydro-2-deoxygluconokinase
VTLSVAPPDLEVVTMGRVGVDLYPEQIGVPLAEVRTFAKSLGGSPTNVAVAAARLGRRAAVITKVGNDGFGTYVREALEEFGVWSGWVGTDPELRTPVVFAEIHPPDHFPMLFYREPRAPDAGLSPEDFDIEVVDGVPLLWATGQGLSVESSRSTTMRVISRRSGNQITVIDIDHRPGLWKDPDEERRWVREAISHATVVVGNEHEAELVVGEHDARGAADSLLQLGPDLAVIKQGPKGSYAARRDGTSIFAPTVPVRTLCGLGAGDAFGGALAHGLLAGWDLQQMLRFASAAGALVASRLACADAMPTASEVAELMNNS